MGIHYRDFLRIKNKMKRNNNTTIQLVLRFLVTDIIILGLSLAGCQNDDSTYKTFTMEEGVVHFSIEYPSVYKTNYIQSAEISGNKDQKSAYFSLDGPLNKKTKDYAHILIASAPPDSLIPDAQEGIVRAERQASKWQGYELQKKAELVVDGYRAYRIDYKIINIVPVIAEDSNEPFYKVYREVRFDAKGYTWMIQISSDSSTAEADKADIEHILATFKVLD
jgi:hypothetical protein